MFSKRSRRSIDIDIKGDQMCDFQGQRSADLDSCQQFKQESPDQLNWSTESQFGLT